MTMSEGMQENIRWIEFEFQILGMFIVSFIILVLTISLSLEFRIMVVGGQIGSRSINSFCERRKTTQVHRTKLTYRLIKVLRLSKYFILTLVLQYFLNNDQMLIEDKSGWSKNHKNNLGSRSPQNFVYFCHSLVILYSFPLLGINSRLYFIKYKYNPHYIREIPHFILAFHLNVSKPLGEYTC